MELGPYNINVNAICPGFVYTPIYSGGGAMDLKNARQEVFKDLNDGEAVMNRLAMSMSAMRRPQSALDMANCALFLASDAAKEMTGQAICVDSGVVMR
jgi:NAD(P)-dependent dehydrogenase (short-subunit alcohol dehydrogenase family)